VVKRIILALALSALLLVPSTALATKKPTALTYTTTATVSGSDTELPATVANLHFELDGAEVCARFDLTVHGSFQFFTGSEFVTMTQQPVPQLVSNCQAIDAFRQDLVAFWLDCETGTFNLERFTINATSVTFVGSDGSTLFGSARLLPLVLTATTAEQRDAICDLDERPSRFPDMRLVAELNELLGLFQAT
jgi:hypothetical protein